MRGKPTPEQFLRMQKRLEDRCSRPSRCPDCKRRFPCGCEEAAHRILLEEQFKLMQK